VIRRPSSATHSAKLRRASLSLGVAAVLFAASGCGQTGPLTLPERAPVASGEGSGDDAPEDTQPEPDER
jgi:predicted small lipoprotein YifL